ncbi:mechanosensitive ion channel family protein [Methylorubrum extorquens]|uniref:mechanosensitive ion channel family protein n=1 Tax=Methylorubrum extorquens TaxID=408 RepID=UPI001FD9E5DF|nr:mechanosensitive ion channel family protein [Methylorubrum extorquens]
MRLRKKWSGALVGPDDVMLLTVVPGRGGIGSIGLAIASIALIAVAPYAAPALATALGGVSVTAVEAGLVIGGVALGYAAQASSAAKNQSRKKTASPDLNTACPCLEWLAQAYDILRSNQNIFPIHRRTPPCAALRSSGLSWRVGTASDPREQTKMPGRALSPPWPHSTLGSRRCFPSGTARA